MSDERSKVGPEKENKTLDDSVDTSIALVGCDDNDSVSIPGFACISGLFKKENRYKENKRPEGYNENVILPEGFDDLPLSMKAAYLASRKYQ